MNNQYQCTWMIRNIIIRYERLLSRAEVHRIFVLFVYRLYARRGYIKTFTTYNAFYRFAKGKQLTFQADEMGLLSSKIASILNLHWTLQCMKYKDLILFLQIVNYCNAFKKTYVLYHTAIRIFYAVFLKIRIYK